MVVIAILNSQIGRNIEDDLSAPARTLIAAMTLAGIKFATEQLAA